MSANNGVVRDETKPRIKASLMVEGRRLKRDRPGLAARIDRGVVLAADPTKIKSEYCATVNSCKCPDSQHRGRACKHRIAAYLIKVVRHKEEMKEVSSE